jgi:hypothetical protein
MNNPEYKIQCDVIVYLNIHYPGVLRSTSPAAGFRTSRGMAVKMVRMGYQKGTPDIILHEPSKGYCGLMIELKAPGGVVSPEQKAYLDSAREKRYCTAVCYSYADAVATIQSYMNSPF